MDDYTNTLVVVADDCPAAAKIPEPKGGKATIASLEYELVTAHPYTYTRDDLLYEVHIRRQGLSAKELKSRGAAIRAELVAKPHPCMRASPLPKTYGWGVFHDGQSRIALVALGSAEYAKLAKDKTVTVLKAMRNKRG